MRGSFRTEKKTSFEACTTTIVYVLWRNLEWCTARSRFSGHYARRRLKQPSTFVTHIITRTNVTNLFTGPKTTQTVKKWTERMAVISSMFFNERRRHRECHFCFQNKIQRV